MMIPIVPFWLWIPFAIMAGAAAKAMLPEEAARQERQRELEREEIRGRRPRKVSGDASIP